MNYKTAKETCQLLKISSQTLKGWKDCGKLKSVKLSTKKFLYDIDSVLGTQDIEIRENVIYARVSNSKQEQDLRNQVNLLSQFMVSRGVKPDRIFSDIASGMNENRTSFNDLIKLVVERKVGTVYISYKDRLTRFGFDYFVNLFRMFGTSIEIVNLTKEEDFQDELKQDLVSIVERFSIKMYSNRRKQLNSFKKELQEVVND